MRGSRGQQESAGGETPGGSAGNDADPSLGGRSSGLLQNEDPNEQDEKILWSEADISYMEQWLNDAEKRQLRKKIHVIKECKGKCRTLQTMVDTQGKGEPLVEETGQGLEYVTRRRQILEYCEEQNTGVRNLKGAAASRQAEARREEERQQQRRKGALPVQHRGDGPPGPQVERPLLQTLLEEQYQEAPAIDESRHAATRVEVPAKMNPTGAVQVLDFGCKEPSASSATASGCNIFQQQPSSSSSRPPVACSSVTALKPGGGPLGKPEQLLMSRPIQCSDEFTQDLLDRICADHRDCSKEVRLGLWNKNPTPPRPTGQDTTALLVPETMNNRATLRNPAGQEHPLAQNAENKVVQHDDDHVDSESVYFERPPDNWRSRSGSWMPDEEVNSASPKNEIYVGPDLLASSSSGSCKNMLPSGQKSPSAFEGLGARPELGDGEDSSSILEEEEDVCAVARNPLCHLLADDESSWREVLVHDDFSRSYCNLQRERLDQSDVDAYTNRIALILRVTGHIDAGGGIIGPAEGAQTTRNAARNFLAYSVPLNTRADDLPSLAGASAQGTSSCDVPLALPPPSTDLTDTLRDFLSTSLQFSSDKSSLAEEVDVEDSISAEGSSSSSFGSFAPDHALLVYIPQAELSRASEQALPLKKPNFEHSAFAILNEVTKQLQTADIGTTNKDLKQKTTNGGVGLLCLLAHSAQEERHCLELKIRPREATLQSWLDGKPDARRDEMLSRTTCAKLAGATKTETFFLKQQIEAKTIVETRARGLGDVLSWCGQDKNFGDHYEMSLVANALPPAEATTSGPPVDLLDLEPLSAPGFFLIAFTQVSTQNGRSEVLRDFHLPPACRSLYLYRWAEKRVAWGKCDGAACSLQRQNLGCNVITVKEDRTEMGRDGKTRTVEKQFCSFCRGENLHLPKKAIIRSGYKLDLGFGLTPLTSATAPSSRARGHQVGPGAQPSSSSAAPPAVQYPDFITYGATGSPLSEAALDDGGHGSGRSPPPSGLKVRWGPGSTSNNKGVVHITAASCDVSRENVEDVLQHVETQLRSIGAILPGGEEASSTGDQTTSAWQPATTRNFEVVDFDFSNNRQLDCYCTRMLTNWLQYHELMPRSLKLFKCSLGNRGANVIASFLRNFKRFLLGARMDAGDTYPWVMEELHLSDNYIENAGIAPLIKFLSDETTEKLYPRVYEPSVGDRKQMIAELQDRGYDSEEHRFTYGMRICRPLWVRLDRNLLDVPKLVLVEGMSVCDLQKHRWSQLRGKKFRFLAIAGEKNYQTYPVFRDECAAELYPAAHFSHIYKQWARTATRGQYKQTNQSPFENDDSGWNSYGYGGSSWEKKSGGSPSPKWWKK
ncbi:unnamed protein product [Amoebophrya sp. A120]|nr:unnamed protein product [Amoebophrya sp. A120]|eukprot:GSA120T00025767001.1